MTPIFVRQSIRCTPEPAIRDDGFNRATSALAREINMRRTASALEPQPLASDIVCLPVASGRMVRCNKISW